MRIGPLVLLLGALTGLSPATLAATPPAPEVQQLIGELKGCKNLECPPFVALVQRGPAVWPDLRSGIESSDEMTRFWSVGVVTELKLEAARPVLIDLLKRDPLVRIRAAAAFALGVQRSRELTPHLVDALGDRDVNVRFEAASALYHSRDPKAVDGLLKTVRDRDADVRGAAIEALGVIGDHRAVDTLLRRATKDRVPKVRGQAAIALGQLRVPAAVEPLIARLAVEKDPSTLAAVAFALGELGDRRALAPLETLAKHRDAVVSAHAKEALKRLAATAPPADRGK